MANIVASTFTASTQADGRQQVHEVHTDIAGVAHSIDYLAGGADDLNANMAAHAVDLGQSLTVAEIGANLSQVLTNGAAAVRTFVYCTQTQSVVAGTQAFAAASLQQALMMVNFLQAQTNGDLVGVFGLTSSQITNLRALPPLAQLQATLAAIAAPPS